MCGLSFCWNTAGIGCWLENGGLSLTLIIIKYLKLQKDSYCLNEMGTQAIMTIATSETFYWLRTCVYHINYSLFMLSPLTDFFYLLRNDLSFSLLSSTLCDCCYYLIKV